jgi:catalase
LSSFCYLQQNQEGATPAMIAPMVGGVKDSGGTKHPAEMALSGSPSVLFDAVVVLSGPDGDKALSVNPDAVGFLMDACRHLKAIGLSGVPALAAKTQVSNQPGVTGLGAARDIQKFLEFTRNGKMWERETARSA